MPTRDQRLRQTRKRRNRIRRVAGVVRNRLARLNKAVRVLNRRVRNLSASPGERAVDAALTMVGKVETGHNDAPWLRKMEDVIVRAGIALGWMIPGNPYCGFGCVWAWLVGADKKLPADTVSTVAIANRAARGDGFKRVSLADARTGDLAVMHFGAGGPKHVGLLTGPIRGGVAQTIEFNTSPGSSGSQANGGGVFKRTRSTGLIHTIARPL